MILFEIIASLKKSWLGGWEWECFLVTFFRNLEEIWFSFPHKLVRLANYEGSGFN
jgi:hypothetical protein